LKKNKIQKFSYLISIIVTLFVSNVHGQQEAEISIPFEVYDNAGGQKTLYFGLDPTASDTIDFLLGESDLPPFPPNGAFEARWLLPKNNFNGSLSSYKDYRFAPSFPFTETIECRLKYQSAEGATIMYFSWNLPDEITGLIQDVVTGTFVNVPISGIGVYEFTDFVSLNQMKLMIYYNNIVSNLENENILPTEYNIEQNYPNPFNPLTKIKFDLPEVSYVRLTIYNSLGQKVKELVNTKLNAGQHIYKWNAINYVSGIYFYELLTEEFISIKKMVLIK